MSNAQRSGLSVIFPVHNSERWVGQALDALTGQADPGIEIAAVDPGNGPGTRQIIDVNADHLTLRYSDAEDASGRSAKMNHGAGHAAAAHMSRLCQDDVWLPDHPAALRNWIANDPAAALHLAPSAIVHRDGRKPGLLHCPLRHSTASFDRAEVLKKPLVQISASVMAPIVRRDASLAAGGIGPLLGHAGDWNLWIKLGHHGAVRFHDRRTDPFRIHDQSVTSLANADRNVFIARHQIVRDRQFEAPPSRQTIRVRQLAEASAQINADLAAAAHGCAQTLPRAAHSVLRFGPRGAGQYLIYSRIGGRSLPRLRAHFARGL